MLTDQEYEYLRLSQTVSGARLRLALGIGPDDEAEIANSIREKLALLPSVSLPAVARAMAVR